MLALKNCRAKKVKNKFIHFEHFIFLFLILDLKKKLFDLHNVGRISFYSDILRLQEIVSVSPGFLFRIANSVSRHGNKRILILLYKLLGLKISNEIKENIREILQTDDESFDGENEEIDFSNEIAIDEEEICRYSFIELYEKFEKIIKVIFNENKFLQKENFFTKIFSADFSDLVTVSLDVSEAQADLVQEYLLNLGLLQAKKPFNMIEGQDKTQIYLIPFLFPSFKTIKSENIVFSNNAKIEKLKKLNTRITFYYPFKPPVIFYFYFYFFIYFYLFLFIFIIFIYLFLFIFIYFYLFLFIFIYCLIFFIYYFIFIILILFII